MSTSKPGRRQGAVYIEPDSLTVVVPAILGALTVGGVSFAMSWDALQVVATWAGVRHTWGLPVALDAAILVFTAFWLVAKRRGRPTWFLVGMVALFTLASMAGNVSHALAIGIGVGWQATVGAFAAAVFPVTTFAMTHVVAGLLVDPDAEVRPVRARAASRAARRAVAQAVPAGPVAGSSEPAATQPAPLAQPGRNVVKPTQSAGAKRTYTDADRAEWERLAAAGHSGREIERLTGAKRGAIQAHLARIATGSQPVELVA